MRLHVKHPDASMVVHDEERYQVKNQVVDVPEHVGASLLLFPDYEIYNGQVELHEDFVKADEEATKLGLIEAEKIEKLEAERKLAKAKADYEEALAKAKELKKVYESLLSGDLSQDKQEEKEKEKEKEKDKSADKQDEKKKDK